MSIVIIFEFDHPEVPKELLAQLDQTPEVLSTTIVDGFPHIVEIEMATESFALVNEMVDAIRVPVFKRFTPAGTSRLLSELDRLGAPHVAAREHGSLRTKETP